MFLTAAMRVSSSHERLGSARLDRAFVHAGGEVVARLALVGVAGGVLQDLTDDGEVVLLQLIESSPALAIGRHRVGGHPPAARELEEVRA